MEKMPTQPFLDACCASDSTAIQRYWKQVSDTINGAGVVEIYKVGLQLAIDHGDLSAVQCLYPLSPTPLLLQDQSGNLLEHAARRQGSDVFMWIWSHIENLSDVDLEKPLIAASTSNNVPVIDILWSRTSPSARTQGMIGAGVGGHIQLLHWYVGQGVEPDPDRTGVCLNVWCASSAPDEVIDAMIDRCNADHAARDLRSFARMSPERYKPYVDRLEGALARQSHRQLEQVLSAQIPIAGQPRRM